MARVFWPQDDVPFVEVLGHPLHRSSDRPIIMNAALALFSYPQVFVADALTSLSKVFGDNGLVLAVVIRRALRALIQQVLVRDAPHN